MNATLLSVENLSVSYRLPEGGAVRAVRGVSLAVALGEVLGIMGESGSGKSTLAAAMINFLPPGARIEGGAVRLGGVDMLRPPPAEQRRLRGRAVAMVFQDPMTAFNPVLTIGRQMADFAGAHVDIEMHLFVGVAFVAVNNRVVADLRHGDRKTVALFY